MRFGIGTTSGLSVASRRRAVFQLALVWHGVGIVTAIHYVGVGAMAYEPQIIWPIGKFVVYETLGLVPLTYGKSKKGVEADVEHLVDK